MKIIYSIGKSDFSKVTHSRIFKLAISLFVAIAIFAFIFWQVEKSYRDADTRETIKKMKEEGVKSIPEFESFSYIDAIENIAIFTISGFDTDPPKTAIGWVAAILSLIFGIVLVGAFTAEISSIFVESRLKDNSAVKNISIKDHILICGSLSDPENFFSQLFHPDHGSVDLQVVFLVPNEPSVKIENIISSPKFNKYVKYIIGSPLEQEDLKKANAFYAKAAFIFANPFTADKNEEDARTILRALAIEAYNQNIETFVQLLNRQNKQHLEATGVDNFISLDEISLNLMAQTCINPGLSELIVNLVNTSMSEVKDTAPPWLKEYDYGAKQEIYRVPAGPGLHEKPFSVAAAIVYAHLSMAVIAVERLGKNGAQNFAVNPGTEWTIKKTDNIFVIADDMEDALSIANLSENDTFPDIEFPARGKIKSETRFKGSPVHRNNAVLEQVSFNNHIIICGIPSGLLTLIEPLRSEDLNDFQRIVILSEKSPTETEWQAIEKLNEIYYVKGSPLKFDDLKRAGIMACSKALILANTKSMSKSEQVMVDADTVMTVMGIEYLQESVYSIAELVYASNIKFLKAQFPVEGGGHNRFSVDETIAVSRIADSLICQAYYTPHVLEIFDEVFSVDKDCGENIRNTCEFYQIRLPDVYSTRSYGELFNYLSTNLGIIPIGLYRKSPAEEYYVLTNPPADTKIRIDDCVYVLSPDEPKL